MMFELGVITNLQLVVLKSEYVSVFSHEYICELFNLVQILKDVLHKYC